MSNPTTEPNESTLGDDGLPHPTPTALAAILAEEPLMKFFQYRHLPSNLQEISAPYCRLAERIAATFPRNAERTVSLRKLLESKDAGVRSVL